jgi:isoquinoline 1-oxidoreductase beta subunit
MNNQATTTNMPPAPTKRRWRISRRGFLIGVGAAGVGLALGVTFGLPAMRLRIFDGLDSGGGFGEVPADPWAWFEVLPDSRLRLYLAKVEMGQGVHTSLAQIAAEELGVGWEDLEVMQATTRVGVQDTSGTTGSFSVSTTYEPLRQAAATLRQMLHTRAASTLGAPATQIEWRERVFVVKDTPDRQIPLGDLVATPGEWEAPAEPVPLKAQSEFKVIGQPVKRVDIPAKVTGQAVYGYDVKAPGMKFGAILRPPTIEGKLKSVNVEQAKTMPGVHSVVVDDDFVGVVADSRRHAQGALAKIEATWDEGKLWQQAEIESFISVGGSGGISIQKSGDAAGRLRSGAVISSEYRSPFAVQTPLEAQAALADVGNGKALIWVSTQMQHAVRSEVVKATGLKEEEIEVIPTYLGGGFGRKSGFEVAVEAARLSQASGVPVHVGWTRTEELRYGYFRPPTHHKLSARLNDQGLIDAIEHQQASGDVAAQFVPGFLTTLFGADFGATRGARIPYNIAHIHTLAFRRPLAIRTGWWRGLGLLANTFAVESFIDELAHLAKEDPLAFRLAHLNRDDARQRRLAAVLEAAADRAGWGTPLAAGRARGLACCIDSDTVVAEIAEISYDADLSKISVHSVTAAMDCGLTINPDGAKAQIEGNIMWGVGSSLIEELQVKDGRITPANFNDYPILTMKEAPHVESVLLEAGDGKPRGVGEPPIGPVAAAIGNAFFSLTGVRLRQIPFTPERIKAAA